MQKIRDVFVAIKENEEIIGTVIDSIFRRCIKTILNNVVEQKSSLWQFRSFVIAFLNYLRALCLHNIFFLILLLKYAGEALKLELC